VLPGVGLLCPVVGALRLQNGRYMAGIKEVRNRLEKLRDELTPKFKQKIEDEEEFAPLCVVIYEDGHHEFLYLEYESFMQKLEVFKEMNEYLESSESIGCLFICETEYEKEYGKPRVPTLYTTITGRGVKELRTYPFSYTIVGGVEWLEEDEPVTTYEDGFIKVFTEQIQ